LRGRGRGRASLAKWETDGGKRERIVVRKIILAVGAVERKGESKSGKDASQIL